MSVPVAYLGVIFIWSTTPLAISVSTVGSNPSFAVFSRMLIGSLLCALLVYLMRIPVPLNKRACLSYLVSGFSMASSMCLTYWAAQSVHSGLISVLFGLSPLMTSLLAMIFLKETSLTINKVLGLCLGFAGLVLVFQGSLQFDASMLPSLLVLLLSVLLQALGLVGMKCINDQGPPLATTLGALLVALPCFGLFWLVSGAHLPVNFEVKTIAAIVYLGSMGSVVGFALYYYLIKKIDASRIALVTLVTPVFALLLGHWLNQEEVLASVWLGTACILCGLVLHHWGEIWCKKLFSPPEK